MIIQTEISAEDFISKLADALADKIVHANSSPEPYVSIEQVAEYFGVKKRTIYDWNQQGCPRTHSKPERYKISAVENWLSKR